MILHSIVPAEIVFMSKNDCETKVFETEYLGEKLLIEKVGDSSYKIIRIISTYPKTYLNPKLQPGNILHGDVLSNPNYL